jgi:hypothetical protein
VATNMLKLQIAMLFVFSTSFMTGTAVAQQVCSGHNSEAVLRIAGGSDFECTATPEQVEFIVYDISLCTSEPDVGDVGSCTSIFNSPSGREILVSDDTSIPLDPSISLENGDYSHVALTIDERIGVKVIIDLGFDVDGWGTTQGDHCWSNGSDVDLYDSSSGNVRCGSLQSAISGAGMSYESITVFEDSQQNATASLDDEPSRDGGSFNIRLIDSSGQLASIQDSDGLFTDTAKMFVIIPLPVSQRVDETSTNIDVGFKVTNLVNMKMDPQCGGMQGCTNSDVVFQNAIINSIGFYATVE